MKTTALKTALASLLLLAFPLLAEETDETTPQVIPAESKPAETDSKPETTTPVLTAKSLGDVENLYIEIDTDADIGLCPGRLRSGLREQGINIVTDPADADSMLQVKLVPVPRAVRAELDWIAVLTGADERQLYSDDGGESGWGYEGACKDALEDLAEDMGDDIRRSRRLKR